MSGGTPIQREAERTGIAGARVRRLPWFATGLSLPLLSIGLLLPGADYPDGLRLNHALMEVKPVFALPMLFSSTDLVAAGLFGNPDLSADGSRSLNLEVRRGDTLDRLFRSKGLDLGQLQAIMQLRPAREYLRILKPGDQMDLVEPGDASLIPYINRRGPLEDPLRIVGSLMILWVIVEIVRLRRHVTGVRRAQLNYFFHGTLIFAAGGAFIVGFVQVAGGFGMNPALGAYFSLPWVAMTFYAITRHRLFDISVVVSRSLAVAIVSVLFFGVTLQFYALCVWPSARSSPR